MSNIGAFQEDAFQNDAFQTDLAKSGGVPGVYKTPPEDLISRLIKQLIQKGKSPKEASKIAISKLVKSGLLDPSTGELTTKGQIRQQMTPAQRAFSRSGHRPQDGYFYNRLTNKIEKRP